MLLRTAAATAAVAAVGVTLWVTSKLHVLLLPSKDPAAACADVSLWRNLLALKELTRVEKQEKLA